MINDNDKILACAIISRWNVINQLWRALEEERDADVLVTLRNMVAAAERETVSPFAYVSEQYVTLRMAVTPQKDRDYSIAEGNTAIMRIRTAIRSHILKPWPDLETELSDLAAGRV